MTRLLSAFLFDPCLVVTRIDDAITSCMGNTCRLQVSSSFMSDDESNDDLSCGVSNEEDNVEVRLRSHKHKKHIRQKKLMVKDNSFNNVIHLPE